MYEELKSFILALTQKRSAAVNSSVMVIGTNEPHLLKKLENGLDSAVRSFQSSRD